MTQNTTNDINEIDAEITHTWIDAKYRSMGDQIMDLVTEKGGVMPQDATFEIREYPDYEDKTPFMTTEAYVPDAEAFEEYVQEWVEGMYVNYHGKDAIQGDPLGDVIEELDESDEPVNDYDEPDWFDIEPIDDYDRISIQWYAE